MLCSMGIFIDGFFSCNTGTVIEALAHVTSSRDLTFIIMSVILRPARDYFTDGDTVPSLPVKGLNFS